VYCIMMSLIESYQNVQSELRFFEEKTPVTLVVVSKAQPASAIRALYALGQRVFGENYLQEARSKQIELSDLDIQWHFLGGLQSNKTQLVAQYFQWVQSVDRLLLAQRLSRARQELGLDPLNVCIQVNLNNEKEKRGMDPENVRTFLEQTSTLSGIKIRGLMAIPQVRENLSDSREDFRQLKQLFEYCIGQGHVLDTLSMGMSADYSVAREEGATMVRIGRRIFGERP